MLTRRDGLGALLAGTAIGLLTGCKWLGYPRASLRYKMTVEVNTLEGIRTGASIVESTYTSGPDTGGGSGLQSTLKGEAVAVDLPSGETLFALLSSPAQLSAPDYHDQLFNDALMAGAVATPPMPRRYNSSEWAEMRKVANTLKPSLELPTELYPMLVRFRDERIPETLEVVDPKDISSTFGAGYLLEAIRLQVTDAPITSKIQVRLPWLKKVGLERSTILPSPPQLLKDSQPIQLVSSSEFSTELYR